MVSVEGESGGGEAFDMYEQHVPRMHAQTRSKTCTHAKDEREREKREARVRDKHVCERANDQSSNIER